MKPFKVIDVLGIGFRLFNKTIKQSKYLQTIQAKEFTVTREHEGVAHLDGEPMIFGKQLDIKVLSASLKLLVP